MDGNAGWRAAAHPTGRQMIAARSGSPVPFLHDRHDKGGMSSYNLPYRNVTWVTAVTRLAATRWAGPTSSSTQPGR